MPTHGATFTGTASTQQASVTIAAGETLPQNGFMLGARSLGADAASISVPPATAAPEVALAGGTVSLITTPAGAVTVASAGDGAVVQASLPVTVTGQTTPAYVAMSYVIALIGVHPQRP